MPRQLTDLGRDKSIEAREESYGRAWKPEE